MSSRRPGPDHAGDSDSGRVAAGRLAIRPVFAGPRLARVGRLDPGRTDIEDSRNGIEGSRRGILDVGCKVGGRAAAAARPSDLRTGPRPGLRADRGPGAVAVQPGRDRPARAPPAGRSGAARAADAVMMPQSRAVTVQVSPDAPGQRGRRGQVRPGTQVRQDGAPRAVGRATRQHDIPCSRDLNLKVIVAAGNLVGLYFAHRTSSRTVTRDDELVLHYLKQPPNIPIRAEVRRSFITTTVRVNQCAHSENLPSRLYRRAAYLEAMRRAISARRSAFQGGKISVTSHQDGCLFQDS